MNNLPSEPVSDISGLKSRRPAFQSAVTNSGLKWTIFFNFVTEVIDRTLHLVSKQCVSGLALLRPFCSDPGITSNVEYVLHGVLRDRCVDYILERGPSADLPVRCTPMTLGHFSSQGMLATTSTASAPPTPMHRPPKPPPFGVCESVPIINRPGKA